ncbi:MAG: energy-coupling factor transporter ATPase [Dictyoglomus sp.]|nr:energy-coupling factor transporter ATPase [Dictyoglomus sp.]MCX7941832.1 energy-coupling factor transporter ATPase [Dictyoglomaceae bacterium]MDW8188066.1 energy-coupling factor transporter ATPase [Dictyoglomus sp.]
MSLIFLDNVSFYYLKNTPLERLALKEISLSINEGERIGIIGETGSGKSTLIQLFNGLLQPTEGKVYLKGKDIREWSMKEICRIIGLVFQYPEHQLFGETVFEEVAFGPRNIGFKEEEIEDTVKKALDVVGLNYEIIKERSPFSLSGGEKRRLAIASILAMDPEVLVLDEPTANLDPRGKRELMQYLNRWTRKNKTLIIVSHDLDEIIPLIKRVIILHKGKIILDGSIDFLFREKQKLIEIGLDLPQILQIIKILEEKGYPVEGYMTLNEIVEIILAYKGYLASWKH